MSPLEAAGPEGSHPHSEPQALLRRWSWGSCDLDPLRQQWAPVSRHAGKRSTWVAAGFHVCKV